MRISTAAFVATLTLALAVSPALTPAFSAPDEITPYSTQGDFEVSWYPHMQGCGALTRFGNVTMMVGLITARGKRELVTDIMSEDWASLEDGRSYDVEVRFDGGSPWYFTTQGFVLGEYRGLRSVSDEDSDSAWAYLDALMASNVMGWTYGGKELVELTLTGSRAALTDVYSCTQRYVGDGDGDGGVDPFK